jgi:hypothetical protein
MSNTNIVTGILVLYDRSNIRHFVLNVSNEVTYCCAKIIHCYITKVLRVPDIEIGIVSEFDVPLQLRISTMKEIIDTLKKESDFQSCEWLPFTKAIDG